MPIFEATKNYDGMDWEVKDVSLSSVPVAPSGFFGVIREAFTGAWQRNVECESPKNLLAFSAVYSCVSLIADDIAKLRIKLVKQQADTTWQEVTSLSPFLPFLRKPNRYQTRIQFLSQWLTSKLLQGNTYVLKERDQRGVVVAGYILDPRRVTPLVAEDGSVYYRLDRDALATLALQVTVPASEIIHDRMITPWHPLVGVTPIYACGASATQGIRIQANSAKFFENRAQPSGMLTAPGKITDATALRLKEAFEKNFTGENIGRLFVGGDGLEYKPMTMPFNDAQLIEQLRFTVEDVARTFHVPLYKLGGPLPTFNNAAMLNQEYYAQTLQVHIEAIEVLMDEGLGLGATPNTDLGVELDLDGLLRMDPMSRAEVAQKLSGVGKINELRLRENWSPVTGGDTVYLQQQNYSVEALNRRDQQPAPSATTPSVTPVPEATPAPPTPAKAAADEALELANALIAKFARAES